MFDLPGKRVFRTPKPFSGQPLRRPSYSAEAPQFFDRLVTPPDASRKTLYATLIDALVAQGLWERLDCLYVAGGDKETMLTSLKSSSYHAVELNPGGSLAFVVDRGITGAVPNVINTTFDPSADLGANYTHNSASFFAFVRNGGTTSTASAIAIGSSPTFLSVDTQLYTNYPSIGTICNINFSGYISFADPDGSGFYLVNRESADLVTLYKNGASMVTNDPGESPTWLAGNTFKFAIQKARQVSLFGVGSSFDSTEQGVLTTVCQAYLSGIEAA